MFSYTFSFDSLSNESYCCWLVGEDDRSEGPVYLGEGLVEIEGRCLVAIWGLVVESFGRVKGVVRDGASGFFSCVELPLPWSGLLVLLLFPPLLLYPFL